MTDLYPDRRPGHGADQAERLAVADLKLTRHLAAITRKASSPMQLAVPDGAELAVVVIDDVDDDTGRPYGRQLEGPHTEAVTWAENDDKDWLVGNGWAVLADNVPGEWLEED